ncbi:class I SAM-dependent methyltransferase [Cytobacillus sp.]|uniref:class I SAM-dependent methyltransferase n=1 Tax=Cytobacillus sp. TaxID=2675269 RepID=UPI0028BE945F|nr:class I SAM-dependent methyltransferase [Cytobacillus sp.]
MQVESELSALTDIIFRIKPRFILEIGNYRGETLKRLGEASSSDAVIIGIDISEVPSFKTKDNQTLYLIQGDSQSLETFHKVQDLLQGNQLDFLFIDGDHFNVEKDFNLYAPLVKNDGLIGFHDIVHGAKELVGTVPEFWPKVKENKRHMEIVENWEQGGYGIGLIYKE